MQEKSELEEIVDSRDRNEAKKLYQKVRCLTEGFKKVSVAEGLLRLWMKNFSKLLRGDDQINSAFGEDIAAAPINDDGADVLQPSHDEV